MYCGVPWYIFSSRLSYRADIKICNRENNQNYHNFHKLTGNNTTWTLLLNKQNMSWKQQEDKSWNWKPSKCSFIVQVFVLSQYFVFELYRPWAGTKNVYFYRWLTFVLCIVAFFQPYIIPSFNCIENMNFVLFVLLLTIQIFIKFLC